MALTKNSRLKEDARTRTGRPLTETALLLLGPCRQHLVCRGQHHQHRVAIQSLIAAYASVLLPGVSIPHAAVGHARVSFAAAPHMPSGYLAASEWYDAQASYS